MKIDWKQKLTSRKLWCAIAAIIAMAAVAICGDTMSEEVSEMMRNAVYVLIAYIFGESAVDISRMLSGKSKETGTDQEGAASD